MLLFVLASHLLLLCFLLHASFISEGGQVGCLDRFLPPPTSSDSLPDEQFRLLRIQILPNADASDWSFTTSSLSSYTAFNTSGNATQAGAHQDPGFNFIYAQQKSLLALLEHADSVQSNVKMDTLYLPRKSQCFELRWFSSLPLWTLVRDRLLGYDTILVNQLVKHFGARGFVYRADNRVAVDMSYGVFNPASAAQNVRVLTAAVVRGMC
jgi:hypothetical protein